MRKKEISIFLPGGSKESEASGKRGGPANTTTNHMVKVNRREPAIEHTNCQLI
jgi:hypothetical protein